MKTIDEIKHIVARQKGFSSWKNMYVVLSASRDSKFFDYENEVATEYAKQCCDEQIKACAENFHKWNPKISIDDILKANNIL